MTTELSIQSLKADSLIGVGTEVSMKKTLALDPFQNETEVFITALGTRFTCKDCVGINHNSFLYVPITSFMYEKPSSESSTLLSKTIQDILSIRAQCYKITNPIYTLEIDHVAWQMKEIVRGVNTTLLDFEVYSRNTTDLQGRRCKVLMRDFAGSVKQRYKQAFYGSIKKYSVEQITSVDTNNCDDGTPLCLNPPTRSSLSAILAHTGLSFSMLKVKRQFLDHSNLFPNLHKDIPQLDFDSDIQKFIGVVLVVAAKKYLDEVVPVNIYSDDFSVKLVIDPILKYLTVVFSFLCVLFSVSLILTDMVHLEKTPNEYLDALSRVLRHGKSNLEALAPFVSKNCVSGTDWHYQNVRFGENKNTISDPLGRLILGAKKDIVKFKAERAYF
jgi:hypothetical protein